MQTLTISDPGYSGGYTASGCPGVVTLGSVTAGSLAVTSVAAGSCTITIVGAPGQSVLVPVTVTTLSVPVQ